MNPNQNNRISRIGQSPKQAQIQLHGVVLMLKGIKSDYHANRHAQKQAKYPLDVGFDLYPTRTEHQFMQISQMWGLFVVSTSLHAVIPPGHVGWITSRSSSFRKLGGGEVIDGKIDPHYTGEYLINVKCAMVEKDDVEKAIAECAVQELAIAQCVVLPVAMAVFARWDDNIAKTFTRGVQGFGSTDMPVNPPTGN